MSNISAKPNPKFKTIFQKRKYIKDNFIQKLIFFNKGRDAILFGLKHLKIEKQSLILIPGYICRSLTEPILDNGYRIEYYDINKDFSINLNYLKKTIENKRICCLIIVHYFGLLTDIKEIYKLCKQHKIQLIEDYCHSFFSRFLREEKDILSTVKIYSIRKNIPVFDGGAIEISNINVKRNPNFKYISIQNFFLLLVRSIELFINRFRLINLYSNFFQTIKINLNKLKSKECNVKTSIFDKNINNPSFMLKKYLMDEKYLHTSCLKRINNYNFLLNEVQKLGLNKNFNAVKNSSVPQFFPICLDSSNKLLFEFLNQNGIETIRWPNYEIPKIIQKEKFKFANSNFLNQNMILLPVHQSLNKNNCKRIISLIKTFLNKNKKINN